MISNNIIFIIIVIILLYLIYKSNSEHFTSGFYGHECISCENKNIGQCLQCNQCGIYHDGCSYKCTRGDKNGPYDPKINTSFWLHNDPFSRYVYENKFKIEVPYSQ